MPEFDTIAVSDNSLDSEIELECWIGAARQVKLLEAFRINVL